MSLMPQSKRIGKLPRRKKTDDEEMLELTEEIMGSRAPLDFASYQQEIGRQTMPVWPIEDPDKVFERIIWHAKAGVGGDKHNTVLQAAQILRALSELCDYVPLGLERVAHISTSQVPETQKRLQDEHSNTTGVEEGTEENTDFSQLRRLGSAGDESDSPG